MARDVLIRCLTSCTALRVLATLVPENATQVKSSAFLTQQTRCKHRLLHRRKKSVVGVALAGDGAGEGPSPERGEDQWTDEDDWSQLSSYGRLPRDDTSLEDDVLFQKYQARADELRAGNTARIDDTERRRDSIRETMSGSLDLLALAVSLFFVFTLVLSKGSLFASSPNPSLHSPSSSRIDADALLRDDFDRAGTSVYFSSDFKGTADLSE